MKRVHMHITPEPHHHPEHRFWDRHHHEHVSTYNIHLLWAEIEFDVKYALSKGAKLRGVEGKAQENFSFTKSDEDFLLRQITAAIAKVRQKIGWASVKTSRQASDELLDVPMEFNIVLAFKDSDGWFGDLEVVMNEAHQYVVDYCVQRFWNLAGADTKKNVLEELDDHLMAITSEINKCIVENPTFIL